VLYTSVYSANGKLRLTGEYSSFVLCKSSGFKSRHRILLFLLTFFFVFLIPTKHMLGWFHGLDHDCFISRPLQIVIQCIQRFFAGVKRSGREADHRPPLSAEVKDEGSCTSTPHIFFHGVDRDSFTIYLLSFISFVAIYYSK